MTDAFNPPSVDPGDLGSMAGLMRQFGSKLLQNTDDCLPARVVSFDAAANRVSVQPLVMLVTTEGEAVQRAPLASLPVFRLGVGKGFLYVPIQPGDLGWIKAADRDLSLVMQSFGVAEPNTRRMHSFQDAVFLPDAMRAANPEGPDAERIVIAWEDGSKVTIGDGSVEVHGVTEVLLKAPLVRVEGDVDCTGKAKFAGGVEGAGGITLEGHKHDKTQPGTGFSGTPTA